ncbi:amino acid permease [Paenibacillus caseinilyticus]|uniref:Transporter n=1 Tax=Paenibacillus mucilaginosus K02 TaxID=997761 RepID=I0BQR0_9BACL|nr:amino acid permease [Paenibacillus mucilaginosus]AFH64707.1 transporter [Paenibacillus mucilaginosus K02]
MSKGKTSSKDDKLKWWQLSLLGVACTIGTGYFLGTGIALTMGGPAVIFLFILAAFGTYMVFDALARMTAADPQQGSFRSYAKKAYGRWAGFTSGWVYWSSELLIMGSQLAALSLFTRMWFPNLPMWMFAAVYGLLGLGIILLGTKGFERLENMFAVMKIAAILMFLVLAGAALFGMLGQGAYAPKVPATGPEVWPGGGIGLWSAFIFAFYAFGGIEIMGLMAMRLKNPKEAPKAGKMMILLLTTVYIASLVCAVILVPIGAFNSKESPFASALNHYNLPFVPHVFNSVLIIAGFSTMVASLFAVTTMLVTLAGDHDAPKMFSAKKDSSKLPFTAIGFTAGGLAVSVVTALLMPESVYEYVTTAAGLMLLYNWTFILVTSGRLLKLSGWGQTKRWSGILLIALAVVGTLFHETSRPGFFISLGFVAVISVVTLIMRRVWKKQRGGGGESGPKGRSKHAEGQQSGHDEYEPSVNRPVLPRRRKSFT